jgi:DNA modification methylase
MNINCIYNEDNLITMSRMDSETVDLTVTSPPYDNLRDYKGFPVYDLKRHRKTAKELFRITKPGGVVCWVVNDGTVDADKSGTSFRQALLFKKAGFKLNDTIIYEKDGVFGQFENRYYPIFEYIFILTKGRNKTFNPIVDRKNNESYNTTGSFSGKNGVVKKKMKREKNGLLTERILKHNPEPFGKRYNIWRYNTGFMKTTVDAFSYEHPAMFPEKLAKDCIYTWSNPGDLVYDPFMGAGTVAKSCIELKRNYIGSEISSEYIEIINKRVKNSQPGLL